MMDKFFIPLKKPINTGGYVQTLYSHIINMLIYTYMQDTYWRNE